MLPACCCVCVVSPARYVTFEGKENHATLLAKVRRQKAFTSGSSHLYMALACSRFKSTFILENN